jgi:protein TonB
MALGAAASVLLHAAALAFGPSLRHETLVPPRIVSVVLVPPAAPALSTAPPSALDPPPAEAVPTARAQRSPAPAARAAAPPPARAAAQPPRAAAPLPRAAAPPPTAAEPPTYDIDRPEPAAPALQSAAAAEAARPQARAQPEQVPFSPPQYAAAYLQNPPPAYPRSARRAGEEGTVVLRILVSTDGAAARVELEHSSGSASLDSAALDAVQRWRFVPARRGATPVEAWVKVPVVFRLAPDA